MMEPRIQYARTSDGVNIAHCVMGEGEPLVLTPSNTLSHVQQEWQIPEYRAWYEQLAKRRAVVRYDCRGSGLSSRNATDFGIEALTCDLEAVVGRLGLSRFALVGSMDLGPAAIVYTARNPERVSSLILWCAY